MKIGIAQIRSGPDIWANLSLFSKFIEKAAHAHCELLCFPENLFYRGPRKSIDPQVILELSEQRLKVQNDFSKELRSVLENTPMAISLGSVLERSSNSARPHNSHWFVQPDKKIASYQKIHLFTYAGTTAVYDESKNVTPGETPQALPFGGFVFGLSICYDLRFPELYRNLTVAHGANILLVPAAFTFETGEAHWHTLLRARAIENLSYVVAAAQWGEHQNDEGKTLSCFGHSIVFDPWGETLAEAQETGDELLMVKVSKSEIQKRRKQLPVYKSVKLI